jgi:hypothetical protein
LKVDPQPYSRGSILRRRPVPSSREAANDVHEDLYGPGFGSETTPAWRGILSYSYLFAIIVVIGFILVFVKLVLILQ